MNHAYDHNAEIIAFRDEFLVRERLVKLEENTKFQHEQLNKIDQKLDGLTKILHNIDEDLREYKIKATIKNKAWIIIYSIITVIATLGLDKLIFKHLSIIS